MEDQDASIAAFSSSALFGLMSLIFLLAMPHRFSMGFRSGEFAGQSSTMIPWSLNQVLVLLAVLAGAKSCWKINQHLHKACQQRKPEVLKYFYNFGLVKRQWTNIGGCCGSPNRHRLRKPPIVCLSTLPPDYGTLISK